MLYPLSILFHLLKCTYKVKFYDRGDFMSTDFLFRNPDLPLAERVEDLVSRLTLEEKAGFVPSRQKSIERLGIQEWHGGCEIARGYVGRTPTEPSTVLPQPIGMAGMFDPDLMYQLGELAANETRVYSRNGNPGRLMFFGPTVDMERDPRWGRTEEAYGEDPYLTGRMTAAYTKGLKGEDPFYIRSVPGLKHFCANNNEKDRGSCSANIEPRTKNEYYYKAFRPAILEGGALSVMASYNEISGVPALLNPDLRAVLKDRWGLSVVISDGGDFSGNVIDHHYVGSHAESIAMAIKAGADIMLDDAELVRWSVLEAVKLGLLTEKELEESIKRILSIRFRLGEFDPDDRNPYANVPEDIVGCKEHKELNRKAAREQVILLKNNGMLPLMKNKINKAAVIGPLADKNYMDWYCGYSDYNLSVLDGLRKLLGESKVDYDSCDDIVALKSKANGKYLSVKDNGEVFAEAETIGETERFEYHDWDFGTQNLYSLSTKRYIREEDGITATGERTYGWFVKEWLKCKEYTDPAADNPNGSRTGDCIVNTNQSGPSYITMDTWNDLPITTDEKGRLVTGTYPGMTDGRKFEKETISEGILRAVRLAKENDVAFVVVGNDPMQVARECYDRPDITLPKHQSDLIRAVYEANPNTVVVVASSYPYALNWEDKNIPAIIYTSHAGPELGTAVADVLFGRYNPAGRTPMTWYRSVRELPDIKDYDIIKNDMTYLYYKGDPLYPFGYGLSYSKFDYHNLRVEECHQVTVNHEKLLMDHGNLLLDHGNLLMDHGNRTVVSISVEVINVSDKDGDEVVQLYFKPDKPRVKRPLKQLCGFQRLHIKAGDRAKVYFDVRESDLEFYDVTREKLCVEAGDYTFMAGPNSRDILVSKTVNIRGEIIPIRRLTKQTPAILYDDKSGVKMLFSKALNTHYLATSGMSKHYIKFAGVDVNKIQAVNVTAATAAGKAGILICIDSLKNEPAARIELPITGGSEIFKTFHGILDPMEGIHDLYFVMEHELSILDVSLS